jgi:hypothetical protein
VTLGLAKVGPSRLSPGHRAKTLAVPPALTCSVLETLLAHSGAGGTQTPIRAAGAVIVGPALFEEAALREVAEEPDEASRLWASAIIHHGGNLPEADSLLQQLIANHAKDSACAIAEVFAMRQESKAAFDWLERAFAQKDPGLREVKSKPWFLSLHGDPRWGAFLKRMGLED